MWGPRARKRGFPNALQFLTNVTERSLPSLELCIVLQICIVCVGTPCEKTKLSKCTAISHKCYWKITSKHHRWQNTPWSIGPRATSPPCWSETPRARQTVSYSVNIYIDKWIICRYCTITLRKPQEALLLLKSSTLIDGQIFFFRSPDDPNILLPSV